MVAFSGVAWADGSVSVLYAGSLVNLMERDVGPAFDKLGGYTFQGYAGGSKGLANQIKGQLRRGDVFISANPKVDEQLSGAVNGDWVRWYVLFAQSPLVIGYQASGRVAAQFHDKPWYEVLAQPGIRIGRTDPKLDPKGAFTVQLLQRAEQFYRRPGLAQKILGADDNPAQVMPEEVLVGRFQSGELDAAFFYSTEAADADIRFVQPPADIDPKASYTATILRDAANPAGAERLLLLMLGAAGRDLMQRHGLDLVKTTLMGDIQAAPASIRALVDSR